MNTKRRSRARNVRFYMLAVVVDMLGFSVADAALILDTSPGTVRSRCARARAILLPYLAHLGGNRSASGTVSPGQGGDG